MTPTRNWQELYKTACSIVRLMRVAPADYRGIGVTLTDLKFDDDKSGKKSIQRTLTDMPISRGQKMLTMISQQKRKSLVLATNDKPENIQSLNVSHDTSVENGVSDSAQAPLDSNVNELKISEDSNNKSTVAQTQTNSADDSTTTPPVDINMLRQLPREIAEEQCQIFGISKDVLDIKETAEVSGLDSATNSDGPTVQNDVGISSYYDNVDSIDNSFLQALPESVRQDVLIQLQEVIIITFLFTVHIP